MAQVDFSNAVLEPLVNSSIYISEYNYLSLAPGGFTTASAPQSAKVNLGIDNDQTSGTGHIVNSFLHGTITNITENGFRVIYDGAFKSGGNTFTICYGWNTKPYWRVSNISFNTGDTFHFQIDVNFNYN